MTLMKTTTETKKKTDSEWFGWMTEEEKEYWRKVGEDELRKAGK